MADENATATLAAPAEQSQDTPSLGPTPEPAAAAPDEAVASPEDDAAPAESDDTGTEEVELEPPAWAAISDAEELVEHEAVKPLVERRVQEARESAVKDVESQMRGYHQRHDQNLTQINKGMTNVVNALQDLMEEGGIDERGLNRLMRNHAQTFGALNGVAKEEGRQSGIASVLQVLMREANMTSELAPFTDRLRRLWEGMADPTLERDLLSALTKGEVEKARQQWEKEQGKKADEIAKAAAQNATRTKTNQKPPAEPKTGGGKPLDNSDAKRLDRLAYGVDRDGNKATDEDRAWLAARN